MTDPMTDPMSDPMTDPADGDSVQRPGSRYGRTRLVGRPHHWLAIAMAAAAITAGVGIAVVLYQRLGTPDVKGDLYGFEVIDDETTAVTINVTRSDPSRPVVCIVRVRSQDGSETGRREVLIGPSDAATVQLKTTVKSSQPPKVGDIYGCGTDIPAYLRAP